VVVVEGDPGVYNIVGDDPPELRVRVPAFARLLSASPAPHVTEQQAQAPGPDAAPQQGNDPVKRTLGFSPRRLQWLSKATVQYGASPISAD
jgi:hypothetical protein